MNQRVNVYDVDGQTILRSIERPEVFDVELREDLVRRVHDLVRQNRRQPYAVKDGAGMQHSAESWGSGRAVARVPRIKGSGTRRAGQGAFANFCRKGRMAHPTKTHRRWHRKTPLTLRRIVAAMAVAATASPAIVEARGHRVSELQMLPLVVSDGIDRVEKTKTAHALLCKMGLGEELQKVKDSKTIRAGKGKYRNRRYVKRKGLLIIHDNATLAAFKNIEGVELMNVNSLDILGLCPGGRLGRLVVWTESAFGKLSSIFGTFSMPSEVKSGFSLPHRMVACDDLSEYFYSAEIQELIKMPDMLRADRCIKTEDDIAREHELVRMYDSIVAH